MRIRHLSVLIFLFASCLAGSFLACRSAASALQSAGTSISNVATFTYSDTTGTFNGTSNTLTIYVQNAAVMTITDPSGISVTPAYTGVDTFTLTNTGNATGIFALTADATFGGTATGTVLKGYILNGGSGTCTATVLCTTYTALNSAITTTLTTITVGVVYQVSATATVGLTVQPTFTANITYAAGSNTSAMTSANVTDAVYSDTLIVDARLDVQASAVQNSGNINWTVLANNGGGSPAQGLVSAKTVFGAANNGVVLFMPVPSFPTGTTYLTVSSPNVVIAGAAGSTGSFYYNTTACSSSPTTSWTTTIAGAKCMAVYVLNAAATVLPSLPGGSSGVNSVSTAQITVTFTTPQPSGTNSGNANAVTLLASSAIGGFSWAVPVTIPILGQGLAVGASQDAATASLLNAIQTNVLASTLAVPPGGASNIVGSSAVAAYSVLVGPFGNAGALGNWSPSWATTFGYTAGSATTSNDFTFVDYDSTPQSINSGANYLANPIGASVLSGGTVVTILGTIQNTGNAVDSVTLTNTTVGTWSVAYYCYNTTAALCGGGDLISTCHGTALAAGLVPSIASQATYNFCASFTPPTNVTTLLALPWLVTGTSGGTGHPTNTTWDVIYPGGVLAAFRTYAVSACPGGVTPANGGYISGCTITYTAYFVNEAPIANGSGGSGNITVSPNSAVAVTENGSAVGSWGNLTGGLTVIPTVSNCASCIFTTAGLTSKSFTVSIPAADLAPQANANYNYAVLEN